MDVLVDQLQPIIVQFLVVILSGIVTYVSAVVGSYVNKKNLLAQLQSKQKYAEIVVNAVQQVYQEANGDEKLKEVQANLTDIFNKNGIKFTETEMNLMIESAVKGMKEGFSQGLAESK
ncbi:phage holin [Enterococcus sp. N249-2]